MFETFPLKNMHETCVGKGALAVVFCFLEILAIAIAVWYLGIREILRLQLQGSATPSLLLAH